MQTHESLDVFVYKIIRLTHIMQKSEEHDGVGMVCQLLTVEIVNHLPPLKGNLEANSEANLEAPIPCIQIISKLLLCVHALVGYIS